MTDYRTVPAEPDDAIIRAMCVAIENTETADPDPSGDGYDYWKPVARAAAPALSASPAPAGDLVERVQQFADWLAEGDPGGAGSVLLSGSVAQEHAADLRVLIAAMQPGSDND